MARFSELADRAVFVASGSPGKKLLYVKKGQKAQLYGALGGFHMEALELLPVGDPYEFPDNEEVEEIHLEH